MASVTQGPEDGEVGGVITGYNLKIINVKLVKDTQADACTSLPGSSLLLIPDLVACLNQRGLYLHLHTAVQLHTFTVW